jgi:hypothetical protein
MNICIISLGLQELNRLNQPWRYKFQGARAINQAGHKVYLVSDGYPRLPKEGELAGYTLKRINVLQEWPSLGLSLLSE